MKLTSKNLNWLCKALVVVICWQHNSYCADAAKSSQLKVMDGEFVRPLPREPFQKSTSQLIPTHIPKHASSPVLSPDQQTHLAFLEIAIKPKQEQEAYFLSIVLPSFSAYITQGAMSETEVRTLYYQNLQNALNIEKMRSFQSLLAPDGTTPDTSTSTHFE